MGRHCMDNIVCGCVIGSKKIKTSSLKHLPILLNMNAQAAAKWNQMSVQKQKQFIANYFIVKCKRTVEEWNLLDEQQKGTLINAFFELKRDEDELRALSDPKFQRELGRLKQFSGRMEQDAFNKMAVNPQTGAHNMKFKK
eukprot:956085_1